MALQSTVLAVLAVLHSSSYHNNIYVTQRTFLSRSLFTRPWTFSPGSKNTMLPLSLSLTIELFVSGILNSTTAAALSHPYPAGGGWAGVGWNI